MAREFFLHGLTEHIPCMKTIRVKRFDARTIKESRIIFLIGKRHTGKSVLMKDILYHMPRPDYVIAMAPTEDTLQMFREFLPTSCVFDHFSQEKLDQVVKVQRELVLRGKKRTVMILLDDCLYQKNVLKSTSMRSIFFNGRHDHITLVCAAQYMMDVDVAFRTNIDYIFALRESILVNRQRLHKYYFGQFGKFEEFDRVMNACTADYKALVLDGTLSSTTATDCVQWYKGRVDIPSFRLCKPVFWRFSERYARDVSELRANQRVQFELEHVRTSTDDPPSKATTIVVTEDSDGQVMGPHPDKIGVSSVR
jgi:hypothetical protein